MAKSFNFRNLHLDKAESTTQPRSVLLPCLNVVQLMFEVGCRTMGSNLDSLVKMK